MRKILICMSFSALGFACIEKEDENESNRLNSGLEASRTVESLSDAEGEAFCRAINSEAQGLVTAETVCTFDGTISGDSPEECQSRVSECLAEVQEEPREIADDDADCSFAWAENRQGCTATVAQMEACVADTLAAYAGALQSVDCNDAGSPTLRDDVRARVPERPGDVPSCAALVALCPAIFGDDDGEGDEGGEGGV